MSNTSTRFSIFFAFQRLHNLNRHIPEFKWPFNETDPKLYDVNGIQINDARQWIQNFFWAVYIFVHNFVNSCGDVALSRVQVHVFNKTLIVEVLFYWWALYFYHCQWADYAKLALLTSLLDDSFLTGSKPMKPFHLLMIFARVRF